jgi:hypothetical protein
VLGVVAALVPHASASHPRHQPITWVADADAGTARWQVDGATPELRAAAAFDRRAVAPWLGRTAAADVAPAPAESLPPPTATATATAGPAADGTRVVTLDLASPRHALRLELRWHSDAETVSVRINGVAPVARTARQSRGLAPGWNRIIVYGSSAHVEITQRGAAPTEAIVSDASIGLPASAAALVRARDAAGAVPVQTGDATIVERHLTW